MSLKSKSLQLFERASYRMPAGVNSPVRAFRAVGGIPVFYQRASGCRFHDIDGLEYVDFCCSWGPLILGHSHPAVVAAITEQAALGTSYGAPCELEVQAAELAAELAGVEMLRFVSSGTEAVMSAIRLARGATGRDRILKFSGCYHGHVDSLMVAAGSGLATFGTASSAGVPAALAELTAVLPLNDSEAFEAFMDAEGETIAAVIIEPIPANNGLLLQRPEFLELLRERCTQHGALLIFDEVISGFRVAPGGAAQLYGIHPDLATYGKVIGGGLPVGAYGGKRELMIQVAPLGPVYQAGTLSGNPLAMAAGLATLHQLSDGDGGAWGVLESRGEQFETGLTRIFAKHGLDWCVVRVGSIVWISMQKEAPRAAEDIDSSCAAIYAKLHRELLDQGVYLAPSAYEVMFLSTAHNELSIDQSLVAFDEALEAIAE